ncbi:hypothetical protein MMC10_010434 [Thelotrema lepadinum]|nr:hypothetical protein [Thelotrema lepadinum]
MAFGEAKGTKLNARPFKPPTMSNGEPKLNSPTKLSDVEGLAKAPTAPMRDIKQGNATEVSRVIGPKVCILEDPILCTDPEHPCPQYVGLFKEFLAAYLKKDRLSEKNEIGEKGSCSDEQNEIPALEDHPMNEEQDSTASTSSLAEPTDIGENIPNDTNFDDSGVALSKPAESPPVSMDDCAATGDVPSPKKTDSQIDAAASNHLLNFVSSVEDSQIRDQPGPDNVPDLLGLALEEAIEHDRLEGDVERNDLQKQEEEHAADEDANQQQQDLAHNTSEELPDTIELIEESKVAVTGTINPKELQINHEAEVGSSQLPGVDQALDSANRKRKRPLGERDHDSESDPNRIASQTGKEPSSTQETVTTEELPFKARKIRTYDKTRSNTVKSPEKKQPSTDTNQIKVFFATSTSGTAVMRKITAIKALGIHKVGKVEDCDIFCTKKGSIAKSPNFLHALALGKPIVTDDWLLDSVEAKFRKAHFPYWAKDVAKEREWRCKIRDTSIQFNNGLKLFEDKSIVVTPALKAELGSDLFDGLGTVALAAGAESFESRTLYRAQTKKKEDAERTIWLAKEKDPLLQELEGQNAFSKDLVAMSVLRAELDLESEEFRLKTGAEAQPSAKKRRTNRGKG